MAKKSKKDPPQRPKLFLSFRHEDVNIAAALRSAIIDLSDHNIDVAYYPEIPGSTEWRQHLERELRDSNGIVFLYTDDDARWKWCLYEIGLFRGLHSNELPEHRPGKDIRRPIICIRTPEIDSAPDPLGDLQAYTANVEGLTKFFRETVLTNTVLGEGEYKITVRVSENSENVEEQAIKCASVFSPPTKSQSLVPIVDFTLATRLADEKEPIQDGLSILPFPLDDVIVTGDSNVPLTEISGTDKKLGELCELLEPKGRAAWLENIKTVIEELRAGRRQLNGLQALEMFGIAETGESYLPILSEYEEFRSTSRSVPLPDAERRFRRLSVSLVPNDLGGRKLYDLRDIFERRIAKIFCPASVIQVRLKPQKGEEDCLVPVGEPVVCRCNESFESMFNFVQGRFGYSQNDDLLTTSFIFNRLKEGEILREGILEELEAEQAVLFDRIVMRGGIARATVPIEFNEHHVDFPNRVFLPDLICKQLVGDPKQTHKILLLVTYVEDFWPKEFRDARTPEIETGKVLDVSDK